MLYYIYIGNSQTAIDHLSKVTNGMFVTVSGARKGWMCYTVRGCRL